MLADPHFKPDELSPALSFFLYIYYFIILTLKKENLTYPCGSIQRKS